MDRIELENKLETLAKGGITTKTIRSPKGFTYTYKVLQWRENGKQKSRVLKDDEIPLIEAQLKEREQIEKELNSLPKIIKQSFQTYTTVVYGDALKGYVLTAKSYKKRKIFGKLKDYIYNDVFGKVFILYGLRRTGKTTMIRQVILDMNDQDFKKTVFIQITNKNTIAELNKDLRTLLQHGFKYVFIDEVTLLEDFIEGGALLADIYSMSGMKIVLSGTDSLGFMISKSNELYDRCVLLHSTFIPYREFDEILELSGIDNYIEYGGTMSLSGTYYNDGLFVDNEKTDQYIDTAIANNIQHSLKNYQYGGHFRALYDLYKKNELTSAINRVIEDMNHDFTVDVLERDFKSNDLRISANNLRRDLKNPLTILDEIDIKLFTQRLKELLSIKNKDKQTIKLEDYHVLEIQEYLQELDLIDEIEIKDTEAPSKMLKRIVFTQPGLRYSQARCLIDSLNQDNQFGEMTDNNKKFVIERILNEIKGRMMEDMVLLETKIAKPNCKVFKLEFKFGEFDMVVKNPDEGTIEIYEIKHSDKIVADQAKHLRDEEKCELAQYRYGNISKKGVLYRGENTFVDGIEYINVEKYLKSL